MEPKPFQYPWPYDEEDADLAHQSLVSESLGCSLILAASTLLAGLLIWWLA